MLLKKPLCFLTELGFEPFTISSSDSDSAPSTSGISLIIKSTPTSEFTPYADNEAKIFYTDVPNLLPTIPRELLGVSEKEFEIIRLDNERKYGGMGGEEDIDDTVEDDKGGEEEYEMQKKGEEKDDGEGEK